MSLFVYRKAVETFKRPPDRIPHMTPELWLSMGNWLERAEKFDFGALVLERRPAPESLKDAGPGYSVPTLTDTEIECWRDNLIPMPAPLCWYEFSLSGNPSGILVADDGDKTLVSRIDYTHGEVLTLGIIWECTHEEWARAELSKDGMLISVIGNKKLAREMNDKSSGWLVADSANVGLSIYLTMMLNSKTTEKKRLARGSVGLARARGVTPRPAHTVVRIVPEYFLDAAEKEVRGTHASPCLHWRRSHIRHYEHATPNTVWAPNIEHKGKKGWYVVVIPRVLVMKDDPNSGEVVSHHYWVQKTKEESVT